MAEWSVHQTHSLAVMGSSPATCWICCPLSRIQTLGHACKYPTGCLLPIGDFNPVVLYLNLFLSN